MNLKRETERAGWGGRVVGALRTRARNRLRERRCKPELVYISVPGGVREEDIRLMMEAVRSVYISGRIPVCPCLMFPAVGVMREPAAAEADRRMRLRLMDVCQSFLICGQQWTEEMWAELNHAITKGMEIQTDQGVGGRPASRLRLPVSRRAREAS